MAQPVEHTTQMEQYARGAAQLQAALARFPRQMWGWKRVASDWSIHQIIVHLADSEANGFVRLRKGIAEPGSTITPYDEEAWASALHYEEQNADAALELFSHLHQANLALVRSLRTEAWAGWYEHPERGPETVSVALQRLIEHTALHVAQMEEVHVAWHDAHGKEGDQG